MKNMIKKGLYYLLHDPKMGGVKILNILVGKFSPFFADRTYIKLRYRLRVGRWLNLKNPKTFNEKLQWLKLYNRNPDYTIMADKVKVKDWVAARIGQEYIIPTLGVWDNPDDIDFESLPNQFVLKCNHNSGKGMYICKDKSSMNISAIKKELSKGLRENYFLHGREWPYKNIPKRILAEAFMKEDDGSDLKDYKVFCFNGKPEIIQVDYDRFVNHKRNIYDTSWNYLNLEIEYPTDPNVIIRKPAKLDKLLYFCSVLSKGVPHLRVDFYSIGGKLYFGELTFFHGSGLEHFNPEEWNAKLGNLITLPDVTNLNTNGMP